MVRGGGRGGLAVVLGFFSILCWGFWVGGWVWIWCEKRI